MPDYALVDLSAGIGGTPRVLHGLAARAPHRFLKRVTEVAWELGSAAVLDRLAPLPGGIRRVEPGRAPATGGALGLYLHWSLDGRISEMVRRQVALWRAEGFAMVFISNAAPPEPDWDAIGADTVLRIARANTGRDFGAWRDGAAEAVRRFGEPTELLLVNDSVLGPFQPLGPLVAAWRAGGAGFFGLTESLGGGPHLQSYALLGRGAAAVGGMLAHLAAMRDSRSKWQVVRQGELGLTRSMQALGLRCAALFPYARLVEGILPETRAMLGPRFAEPGAFARFPLNPCHHFWRELVAQGYPYLKTELVRNNPGDLAGVADWAAAVPAAEVPLIRAHLAALAGREVAAGA